jgi:hypothetical protein
LTIDDLDVAQHGTVVLLRGQDTVRSRCIPQHEGPGIVGAARSQQIEIFPKVTELLGSPGVGALIVRHCEKTFVHDCGQPNFLSLGHSSLLFFLAKDRTI